MSDDLLDRALCWEVGAIRDQPFVETFRLPPLRERFRTEALADVRKKELQVAGMIASVTPIFVGKAAMKACLEKRQTAPLGDFCARWKLAP